MIVSLIASVQNTRGASAQITPPPHAWGELPLVSLPALPGAHPAPLPLPRPSGPSGIDTGWSKRVYQSLRDLNWEIYGDDGYTERGATRLTNSPAADIEPRLNFGATQIAFVSMRDGDYEIFSMNLNGSNVRQLTANTSADTWPTWSPDSSRIAFQTQRSGVNEIYVMNADGSQQMRLTPAGVPCVTPAWSTDGSRIAYACYRNNQYAIWTSNPDGTGEKQVGPSRPYAELPVWNRDGSMLAFDADADGDGFTELFIMNADGSGQAVKYDAGGQVNVMAGAWSWESMGITIDITQLYLVSYQGQWYWTDSRLMSVPYNCCSSPFPISSDTTAWHPSWMPADIVPPITTMSLLPLYSRCTGFNVGWNSQDQGTPISGIGNTTIQQRIDEGNWQPWADYWGGQTLSAGALIYTGACGQKVEFRARSYDILMNLGEWSKSSGQTTGFTYLLSGTIQDTRNTNLPTAHFSVTPTVAGTVTRDPAPQYLLHLRDALSNVIRLSIPGYRQPDILTWTVQADGRIDYVLQPIDDVLTNGDFEAGFGSLSGWSTGGNVGAAHASSFPDQNSGAFHGNTYATLAPVLPASWGVTESVGGAGDRANDLATAFLQQTVQIPPGMNRPTLSFMYQLSTTNVISQWPFSIRVDDGITSTSVFTSNQLTSQWVHGWVDMTPWLGEHITVTFEASMIHEFGPQVKLSLDDLTLGSWLTPRIDDVMSESPWNMGVITITGDNFIMPVAGTPLVRFNNTQATNTGWISSTLLTASVPLSLTPGFYLLEVSNPGGQANLFADSFHVGMPYYFPIIQRR
jgi:hypothetical protein